MKRPHYPSKALDEITYKLRGVSIFSKLDAKSGYWYVLLDHQSSLKTTFNTLFGRFRYLRLTFRLSVNQDIFQKKMDDITNGYTGTISIADDTIVYDTTRREHDNNLHELMTSACKGGLVFNKAKCLLHQNQVTFYGVTINQEGVSSDKEIINMIEKLKLPCDKKQLHDLIGIATYMSPFIPQLSNKTSILRDLLNKVASFIWSDHHEISDKHTMISRN